MTHGSLSCQIPMLQPDDDLVDRLASLAAASRPSRGGSVVPVAFGGPTGRAVAVAAAVAAITAGAAAAATQLTQSQHPSPTPPITSISTPGAHRTARDDHQTSADDRSGAPGRVDHASSAADPQAVLPTSGPNDETATTESPTHPATHPTSAPSDDGPGDDNGGPGDDGDDNGGQDNGDNGDSGDRGGGDDGSDAGSDDASDSDSDGGSQDGGGTQDGSDDGSGTSPEDSSAVLTGRGD